MFPNTEKLLVQNAFNFDSKNQDLFLESLREMATHHYDHCLYLKNYWKWHNVHPSELKTEEDLIGMPFTPVNLFKEQEWITGEQKDIVLTLGSSGTAGQRSVMLLDQGSLDRVKKLAFNVYRDLGITSEKKYNYLCFTYDPKIAHDVGTAFTDELLTSFTGVQEIFYALQWDSNKNDFILNEKETIEKFHEYASSPFPTRILGFPAFLYQLINKYSLHLKFPDDSWTQTGGGWKKNQNESIPKAEFREFIEKRLAIPTQNQRDLFGMVEHGIPYVDDSRGKLRIPNYARVIIRSPYTLKPVMPGQTGLIQFICSYNSSYPSFNLLTTDWGKLNYENDSLGEFSLEIVGRAGTRKNVGCALKALDLLGETK